MANYYRAQQSLKLFDCARHAPEVPAELFIVEGDSAVDAVTAVRNGQFQAVLPIQGKPLNALKASSRRIVQNPWFAALLAALGSAAGTALPLADPIYRRILLLLDPDADGIHCAALLQMFFYRFMRRLIEDGQIDIVHAPWGELRPAQGEPLLAYHEAEFQSLCRQADARGESRAERVRHRGLATITPALLAQTCIDPRTRNSHVLTVADVELAIAIFDGRRVS